MKGTAMLLSEVTTHYARAWSRVSPNFVVHLFFVAVSSSLLVPVAAGLGALAISFSDQSALTDQDIARFLLTPAGLIGALVVLSLAIVVTILDVAVMTAILRSGARRPGAALRAAVAFALTAVVRLILFAAHLLVRVLALVLPFVLIAGAVAYALLTEYDINFYLSTRPPAFLLAAALIGLTLMVMAILLIRQLAGWSLAMHAVLFDRRAVGAAFRWSKTETQSRRGAIFLKVVIWLAIRAALGAVLGLLGAFVIAQVARGVSESLILAASVLAAVFVLTALVNMVLTTMGNGALADLLNDEFDRALDGRAPAVSLSAPAPGGPMRLAMIALPVIAVGLAGASLFAGDALLERIGPDGDVVVIGHRGAAGSRPENTMAAVEKAIEDGADWIEIDVQEAADGTVVVVHDSDFMKAAGVDLKVWDASMEDLADIDIGSWFDPAFADQRTPRLSDVLTSAKDRARVIIELKYYGHDEDLENRVIALVEAAGMEDQIATMSLKYPAVQKMLTLRPTWRTGVLAATAIGDMAGLDGDFLAVNASQISTGLIERARAADKDVYAWTVNDALSMSRMISMGVDGLITDQPALARQVIADRKALSTQERYILALSDRLGVALGPRPSGDEVP
ncbi:MAG: glycerophosphodiester phosphodiesterase family protein [Pseudomonadota bacterium]